MNISDIFTDGEVDYKYESDSRSIFKPFSYVAVHYGSHEIRKLNRTIYVKHIEDFYKLLNWWNSKSDYWKYYKEVQL